jgi:isochorismate synthase
MVLDANDGFVIYQLPDTQKLILRKGVWNKYSNQNNGFIVKPFDGNEEYIMEDKPSIISKKLTITPPSADDLDTVLEKQDYLIQLGHFIDACISNKLDKVISSRKIIHHTENQIDLFELFKLLAKKHENALVYLLHIPSVGMWMGATPETLVYSSQDKAYTVALAATSSAEGKIKWKEKEIQEHQFVIDDISTKLKAKNIKHQVANTKTINAGDVSHLKTTISLNKNASDIISLADTLHPTSAVCGMPQEEAKAFILENENYNREFYTGYLGELSSKNESWLFVNLRCMQVYKKSFSLYVGGGITKDSIAENEWEETELKSRTLLSAIEKM